MASKQLKLVIITGMSGAGKTVAMQSLEDLGYFCVDNLPPSLLPKFWELMKESDKMDKIALVMDLRGREFFDSIEPALDELDNTNFITTKILFLEADDKVLVSRYKETRRHHPLEPNGSVLDGINAERELLSDLKGRSQLVINTSNMAPRELRERINNEFQTEDKDIFNVQLMSFGFKYGIPIDADLVFDVRFLPNPHYIDKMRPLTGLDEDVYEYVMKWPETQTFLDKLVDLLMFTLPFYKREGKTQLVIAIGCTGGQHRSVALTEFVGKAIQQKYETTISHRDMKRRKGR
ncbi:RNase adaptor protein RapZ [Listeria monocytogenes]|uniref:Nucleotide-binding protein Lm4b_02443 n=5 Tax=Listeria monocytogenes TaxID=1639 RepID=Y2443_LISMC|nr:MULTISPECIES: RNase adapter RapZ [Listeria]C1KYP1.1 RecName: Full=Nucleotide-binding protein Lm4b_02443 [Listeria monocytogenes serotype 4b str. CLIP 80459]Q71WV3.1 RecName: Full=Nucleotide-binding protein LMOf2365_2447 [Listeria monocytogenes serotype 4b str. F2365]EAD5037058.1 RNase adapter RapZ [Listeria monocytogenes serotype 1/2a]EAE1680958.1 RNase adapter RapZ [Listeria monocytogenes LIS0071]EAE3706633.1 RNase adapter RapZ [Listeria monocytogenes serotype 1/2b]EAG6254072.1 RNase adap